MIFLLTGKIRNITIFMLLIIIHELGHYITAKTLNWKTDKIYLYPYGGITKFKQEINTSLKEELIVLIMGPITQIIFFFLFKNIISNRYLEIFETYNKFILIFNLLPIYPLDGGKLLMVILSYITSFKKSFKITSIISYITIIISLIISYQNKSIFFVIIMIFLLTKLIDEINNFKLIFQKFILERITKKYRYKTTIMIDNINDMKKDKYHLIKKNNIYLDEKKYLNNMYKTNI